MDIMAKLINFLVFIRKQTYRKELNVECNQVEQFVVVFHFELNNFISYHCQHMGTVDE
jgi:hypothetical protein